MRKRLLAILLTGILLGLSACGSKTTEESKEAGKVATEESQEAPDSTQKAPEATEEPSIGTEESGEETASTEEEAGQEEQSEVTESDATVEQEPMEEIEPSESTREPSNAPLSVKIISEDNRDYVKIHTPTCTYDTVFLLGDDYPALAKELERFNQEQAADALKQIEWMDKSEGYEYSNELLFTRADKRAFSILMETVVYHDEKEESGYFDGVNWNTQSGEKLVLADVIKAGTDLEALLIEELQKNPVFSGYDTQTIAERIQEVLKTTDTAQVKNVAWTLGYKGIDFYVWGEDIGVPSNLPKQFSVLYEEHQDIFEEYYFQDVQERTFEEPEGDYVLFLTDFKEPKSLFVVDLYGDGKEDYITFTMHRYEKFAMAVNDNPYTVLNMQLYLFDSAYLVKKDGKYYLYLQLRFDVADIMNIEVLELTDNTLKYVGSHNGGLSDFADPDCFEIYHYEWLYNSCWVSGEFHVGSDGMPVLNDYYTIGESERYDYASLLEITAELVDGQGNLLGETYTFPVGTEFWFIRTDCETYVDARTGDGRYCRLYIDWPLDEDGNKNEYWPLVNGVPAEYCFGELFFAG